MSYNEPSYKIFSVDEDSLTDKICDALHRRSKNLLKIDRFSDGEFSPQFQESIRNQQVFLICSTNTPEKILKLALAVDGAKRASAAEIVAVIPYYGYSRQDGKEGSRGAIGAKVMADIFSAVGIHRVISVDLHAAQIQGFFNLPVDHISGFGIFQEFLDGAASDHYTICSPDAGGVKRAGKIYNKFVEKRHRPGMDCDINFALMSKRRDKPNSIESMELIGDVKDRTVILVDDMTDTAGTLLKAAEILKQKGAKAVWAMVTHGILSGDSLERVNASQNLDLLVTSDSLNSGVQASMKYPDKIICETCATSFARAISSVAYGKSLHEIL